MFVSYKPLLLVFGAAVSLSTSHLAAAVPTPKDDFVSWYRDWSTNVPQTYKTTYKQFFKHPADLPLIMTISNWVDGEYRLCSIDNSDTKRSYRTFSNRMYGASIETGTEAGQPWALRKYALRDSPSFQKIMEAGTDPLLLGPATIFDKQSRVKTLGPPDTKTGAIQVEISFPRDASSKPRDMQSIVATLDPSVEWMPTEIKIMEFGGAVDRKVISGWRQLGNVWIYDKITSYYRPSSSEAEVVHSVQDWDFSEAEERRDHKAECYLKFYDLPEPAGSEWPWRVLVFVVAIILLSLGYVLLRRANGPRMVVDR